MTVFGLILVFYSVSGVFGDKESLSNITHSRRHNTLPEIRDGEICTPGRMYRMECNTCKCTDGGGLMCTKMACLDVNMFAKRGKKVLRNNSSPKLSYLPKLPKEECNPGQLYRSGCRRCFCDDKHKILCSKRKNDACIFDKEGNPHPIRTPEDVRPSFPLALREDIPTLASASEKCEPGKTYRVDCNNCICMASYDLVCQMMLCVSFEDMNRIKAKEQSGHECTASGKEKFSSKCVKCLCIGGSTDCKPVADCKPSTTQKLSGLKIQNEISPDEKCVPDTVYRRDCNKCYCQPDGSLRCTQMACLNYSQVTLLQQQRDYLEKHGL